MKATTTNLLIAVAAGFAISKIAKGDGVNGIGGNKYKYYQVIQQHYGQGWEDVSHYETDSNYYSTEPSGKTRINKYGREVPIRLITHDFNEYVRMGYPTRIVNRKEKA